MADARRPHPSPGEELADGAPYHLTLTTLGGNEIVVPVLVRDHRSWETLEDLLVESLPMVSQIDTLGCELALLHPHNQEALTDPIQDALRDDTHLFIL